jgi:hypothetical protein
MTSVTDIQLTQVLALDEGQASSLDAVAASVALFGAGRLELRYAPDLPALRQMATELSAFDAPAIIVVDVDDDAEPKSVLAEAAELGLPLAVLSDGRSDAIHDHALSVGADAYLLSALPARTLVASLAALSDR